MREILKKLGENKYYEHINYIINRINGVPTPHIPPELEEKLCNMFKEIQGPFLKHCPRERKNFLSYSYVLYKFFQILELDEYLKYFSLLKSREKLYVQDQIFKHICKDLGWKFVPSLWEKEAICHMETINGCLGEAHQTEASGQTSTLAGRGTDGGGNKVQNGEDGSGGQGQQQDLLEVQGLGRQNGGNDTNDQTLH